MPRSRPVPIAMLNVTLSNRFEVLLEALLERMNEFPNSPFRSEQIIVPSTAIRRKVTLAAADKFGIVANVEFSYLAQWLWRQIGKVVPVHKDSPFSPAVLSWRMYRILEDNSFTREHHRLSSYLAHADDVMRMELACRIASLFDEYVAYRPDWLAAWSAGQPGITEAADIFETSSTARSDRAWQAALWRRILLEVGLTRKHPAALFFEALNEMGSDAAARLDWPRRVHIFCLPTMAPQYIEMLGQLGQWMDLQLYVLNPCREYWFEIVDPRRLSYLAARGRAEYHESGNRLLAAWGKQCQAQLDLLLGDALRIDTEDSRFLANAEEKNDPSLLGKIQDAILELRDLTPEEIVLADGDRSLEVHVCHSLTRELEVLHDQLLAMFAGDDPPRPQDILVVTPDLEQAAPLIDAVFSRHTERSDSIPGIPYVITGRGSSKVNPVARSLVDLLNLATSRFDALSVYNLLRQRLVARRFCVDGELDTIHEWMTQSGIRWGVDGSHREQFELPLNNSHTFEDGMHRLFMGYALPSSTLEPFNGRLPAGNAEGKNAVTLGCFWHYVRQLDSLRKSLHQPKTADGWMQALFEILDAFMQPDGDQIDDMEEVRERIRELHGNMAAGFGAHPVSLEVIRAALANLLDDPARGGVPTGSVTFSSMSSLRNLPYRVVCAIGMNDGSFPTDSKPAEFDLMKLVPRRGDRQRRFDERNLFLDLMLAARERLYISYVGNSVRDNSPIPPSVLVSELLDYLYPVREKLVIRHPLQAFSADYFAASRDARLVSYNMENFEALLQKASARTPAALQSPAAMEADGEENDEESDYASEEALPFFVQPLPEPAAKFRQVELAHLISFFRNPCRFLLRHRLGIRFPDAEEELQHHEPFIAGYRERQLLAERLLPMCLSGKTLDDIRIFAQAGVEYPSGAMGDILLEQELKALSSFADTLRGDCLNGVLQQLEQTLRFDLDGEAWCLHGSIGDMRPSGLVRYRYDATSAADYLAGWIEHLFLNAAGPENVERQTVWHSRDGRCRFRPCEQAGDHLRQLLRLYRSGLSLPLHFYPRSAWKYVTAGGMGAASQTWRQNEYTGRGECTDPSYRLALRGEHDPLDAQFVLNAETVFGPLLQHLDDPRLQ